MESINSKMNQQIKDKFVSIHVYANVTTLVEFVLFQEGENSPFSTEDIINLYYYVDKEGNQYTATDRNEQLKSWKNDLEDSLIQSVDDHENASLNKLNDELEAKIEYLEQADSETYEVMEWWVVSDWLGEQLELRGQPILTDGFNTYWGRCTTGQAIMMDLIIGQICLDLEILHGMKNAWA